MSKVLVIGNGFDLSLGLATSYKDFVASTVFQNLATNYLVSDHKIIRFENAIAGFVKKSSDLFNWVDVELALVRYAQDFDPGGTHQGIFKHWEEWVVDKDWHKKNTHSEFRALKVALMDYLVTEYSHEKVVAGLANTASQSVRQLLVTGGLGARYLSGAKEPPKPFDSFYSLNYTDSLSVALTTLGINSKEVNYVHGTLRDRDIVFGIQERGSRDLESGEVRLEPHVQNFPYFLKSDHAAYGRVSLRREIENVEEVHFFGCSLGETDDTHFSPLFTKWAADVLEKTADRRRLVFYIYGHQSYHDLRNRLVKLTGGNLAGLKQNAEVYFYDLESQQDVDQEWLNQPIFN